MEMVRLLVPIWFPFIAILPSLYIVAEIIELSPAVTDGSFVDTLLPPD